LGTLIRHFLPGAVLGLPAGVVAPTLAAALVAAIRRSARVGASRVAARCAAVALPVVAAGAQVEDGEAAVTADLAEAVVVIVHGLP
jgi:hypothetical protein